MDEASHQTGAGIGFQLKSPTREIIKQAIHLGFNASNNESEYEATLAGIELAATVSAERLLIRSDSLLLVGQVNEEYESRDPPNGEIRILGKRPFERLFSLKA